MTYPRGTAYHEAGHAVVAWSLGLPVGAVRVSDDDASGAAEIGSADQLSLIEQIAVRSAGIEAETVFNCPAHELAGAGDRAKILKLLEAPKIAPERGRALRDAGHACARTRLQTHSSRVIRLAERLVQCGHVDASEFLRLMHNEAAPAN